MHSTSSFFMTSKGELSAAKRKNKRADLWCFTLSMLNWVATVSVLFWYMGIPQWNTQKHSTTKDWVFFAVFVANCLNLISFESKRSSALACHLLIIFAWIGLTKSQSTLLVLVLCFPLFIVLLLLTFIPSLQAAISFRKKKLYIKYYTAVFCYVVNLLVVYSKYHQGIFEKHNNEVLALLLCCENWMIKLHFFDNARVATTTLISTFSSAVHQLFYLFLCAAANPTNTED